MRTWRIGRVAGVDLLIRPSLLLAGAALVVVFAPRFDARAESDPYLLATAFVAALYLSVLVHEIAHVVAARWFDMRVRSVTLHLLGGETLIEGESRTPWQELTTAVVGPLTSLAIGLAALWASAPLGPGVVDDVVWSVGWVNVILAAFNLLPGLPLDGGRVFRSIVWAITGDQTTGIRTAGWVGRFAAVLVVVAVLVLDDWGTSRFVVDLLVAAMVALMLWQGSQEALDQATRRSRVDRLDARRLADTSTPSPVGATPISADLHGADLLRAMSAAPADVYAVTESDGSVRGVLRAQAVNEAVREGTT